MQLSQNVGAATVMHMMVGIVVCDGCGYGCGVVVLLLYGCGDGGWLYMVAAVVMMLVMMLATRILIIINDDGC